MLILTALAYVGATIAMKAVASVASPATILLLALALALAGTFEVLVLQRVTLGAAYVTIVGLETLLVLGYAVAIGEGLAPREMAGGALVLAGAVVLFT
ncbi:MAG: 5-aminolevulinate synthase [Paracoccaceae bacterium]|nr:5-aminolevulinate synthase [Paracoccaceae bacterium]